MITFWIGEFSCDLRQGNGSSVRKVLAYMTVYVNDFLITSNSCEEHCRRVKSVLNKFSENNVTLKLEKSTFLTHEVQFLGFKLSSRGITIATGKVVAIHCFPEPKNIKQLQSFLGMCN